MSLESFQFHESTLSIKLRSPQSVPFTLTHKNILTQLLADALDQDISVDISIVQFIRAESFAPTTTSNPLQNIHARIERFLALLYPAVIIVDTKLIESHQTVIIADFYSALDFDTERFHALLDEFLRESTHSYDTLLINRHTPPRASESESEHGSETDKIISDN
jgi:hypothetical protein